MSYCRAHLERVLTVGLTLWGWVWKCESSCEEWINQKCLRQEGITGLQMWVCFASIAHCAPTVSAVFTNTPRNVGHILPGHFGQCFCSPLSDPLGQLGALTQRYQARERPAVSLSPFLRVGQEWEATWSARLPLGRSLWWNLFIPRASHRHWPS